MLTLLIIGFVLHFILNAFLMYKKYGKDLFKVFPITTTLEAIIFGRPFIGFLFFGTGWFNWNPLTGDNN